MSQKDPQFLYDSQGHPTHVLITIGQYLDKFGAQEAPAGYVFIPSGVAKLNLRGASPLRSWREHLKLTQDDVAGRMGVSRSAYAQMEQSEKPHRATLEKAARAFDIELEQILELYDDEPVTTPEGKML